MISLLRTERFRRWSPMVAKFFLGQSINQAIGLLTGFLLLRWLSIDDYAQCSFTLGFQSMIALLLDMGFSGSIVALVGDRTSDPAVVGAYISTAKYFRRRIAIGLLPLAAVFFLLTAGKHGWSYSTQFLLYCSAVCSVFAQGTLSMYTAPLLISRQPATLQRWAAIASVGRLLTLAGLHAGSLLNGWMTAWSGTLSTFYAAVICRRITRAQVLEPEIPSVEVRRDMVRYLAPLMAGLVFVAFQSQITIFLIATFGHNQGIAEVAALGRIGQLFGLLGSFNGAILQPYIAARPGGSLWKSYWLALLVTGSIAGAICTVGCLAPTPLLWLLGPKFSHLSVEMRWMLVASTASYMGGVMWTMHAARKWVFWWGTWAYIFLVIATPIFSSPFIDFGTTRGVVYFSVISSVVVLGLHISTAIYGFRQNKPLQT